jgi:hypothetical protein
MQKPDGGETLVILKESSCFAMSHPDAELLY